MFVGGKELYLVIVADMEGAANKSLLFSTGVPGGVLLNPEDGFTPRSK